MWLIIATWAPKHVLASGFSCIKRVHVWFNTYQSSSNQNQTKGFNQSHHRANNPPYFEQNSKRSNGSRKIRGVPHSLSCFPEPSHRPESCSARSSGSDRHTLATSSGCVDVAAPAIPVTRCRCAQSAAYHRFVCGAVGSLLCMPFYLRSKYAALPLLAQQCGTLAALRAPCLLRRLAASQLLLCNSSASRTRCFAPAGRHRY